jgi:hypothetical protein
MDVQPTPSEVLHPYVEQRPNIQGGRAVIKGSRFPVNSIVQDYPRIVGGGNPARVSVAASRRSA